MPLIRGFAIEGKSHRFQEPKNRSQVELIGHLEAKPLIIGKEARSFLKIPIVGKEARRIAKTYIIGKDSKRFL